MHMRSFTRSAALALVAAAPALLLACESSQATPPPATPAVPASSAPAPAAATANASGLSAVDEAALDRSVSPCTDFYQFACGGWQKATKIPDDEARWSRAFSVIQERNEQILRDLLEAYAKGEKQSDAYAKKLGDLYASCMDEGGIERAGTKPLEPYLALAASVKDAATFTKAAAELAKVGVSVPFTFGADQDFKNAERMIGMIFQHGLGLPDRDYYLADDARKKAIRAKYEEHATRMFELLGDKPEVAKKNAATVLRLETSLAKVSMKREDMRDPHNIYHPVEKAELKKLAPEIGWDTYFTTVGAKNLGTINVAQPEYLKAMGQLVKTTPAADLRTYLRWHVVAHFADELPKKFQDEAFQMKAALRGTAKQPPRWKQCVRGVNQAMGEALGQGFVKATLGSEGKDAVRAMIHGIEGSMEKNLQALGWMDDTTRARALDKLHSINNKVAYPDKWRSYEKLEIDRGPLVSNAARAQAFEHERDLAKLGKPVDRDEWGMSPPTVNAYYNPSLNEMVFPAGILQPPFYGNGRTLATNLGGIGMVMGHELTHGFDDSGREFDGKGNMNDWWTPAINAEFNRRAACVEKQYGEYSPVGEEHLNGKLTLGENIADLGGMKLAYNTLKTELGKRGGGETIGGFTPEQQFFLGYAQGWCSLEREQYLRLMVMTDPHSPPKFRVVGVVSNMKEFANAFQCKAGDKMVRSEAERCEVW